MGACTVTQQGKLLFPTSASHIGVSAQVPCVVPVPAFCQCTRKTVTESLSVGPLTPVQETWIESLASNFIRPSLCYCSHLGNGLADESPHFLSSVHFKDISKSLESQVNETEYNCDYQRQGERENRDCVRVVCSYGKIL